MNFKVLDYRVSFLFLSFIFGCNSEKSPTNSLQPIPTDHSSVRTSQHQSSTASNSTLGQWNSTSNGSSTDTVRPHPGNRPVYLAMHVRLVGEQTFPPTYEKLFPVYASLHFNGTSADGPLEIQLINRGQDIVRVSDWGLQNDHMPLGIPQPGYLTEYFELFGQTNVTNQQILDPSTGKGLIHKVWSRNATLALKAYNSVDFMHAFIAELNLGLAPSNTSTAVIPSRIILAQTYWRNLWVAERVVTRYPVWYEKLTGWGAQVQKTRAEFHWEIGSDPSAGMVHSRPVSIDQASSNQLYEDSLSSLAAPEMTETYLASTNITASAPEYQVIYAQPTLQHHILRRDPVRNTVTVISPGDQYNVAVELVEGTNQYAVRPADDLVPPANQPTDVTEARSLSRRIVSIARRLGTLGAAIGSIALIVLDFKDHMNDHFGMVFAIVSAYLVLCSVALAYLPGAGLAFELVMLSSTIIGAVPELASMADSKSKPHSWRQRSSVATIPSETDIQGILQYTIVGDRNQTGNENCLKKGYQECKIVYGPYLLALAFQIELFDAFALLIHYNEGFPMAMADLVKAFTLKTDPDSGNRVATIDCSHSIHPHDRNSQELWNVAEFRMTQQQCNRPIFSINRPLITIPVLDETADVIYDRLMPKGNCSLIGDVVGGEKFAAYNFTLHGGAVSVACGIVGALNINQTAQPLLTTQSLPKIQNTTLSLANLGNQSSDGSSGRGYLAPPPPSPFQPALNLSNSVCLGALPGGNTFCLPNGTYSRQDGTLGFDSTKANALTLAANSTLTTTEITRPRIERIGPNAPESPLKYADHQYTTNQSVADVDFAKDMQDMTKYIRDNTFAVKVPIQPDAVCFYQLPLGKGNFACFGPGGGDLPAGLKGNVRSVKAYGRASVEIFANNYGNKFAYIIDTYEDDLSQLPYDTNSNFGNVASAIWVYLEQGPTIPTTIEP